ncbi:uncharacterized protein LOC119766248 [Culex quinquefasciatus]|uniref:uncharacterized protein LOC119766248 n=1 Tax=Culex quinquefasciatus TaxID=7176 RepID=UPI0018E2D90C|nr:uncharacterized protein LOC119766248 [Culex quinquefasciatus]
MVELLGTASRIHRRLTLTVILRCLQVLLTNNCNHNRRHLSTQSGQREGNDHGLQDRGQFGGITPEQLASRQVLPRKLPIFSGSYEEWPLFISCYNTTTEACGYTNNENLVRLLDCLRDPALGHVRGQLLLPQSVPRVIETLRRIYGRPEQLLQSLLMKARRCDPPKSDRLETFITFSLVIEQLCDHLEATNLQDHLVNPMLLQELVDKTPAGTKLEWVRFKRRHGQVTLRTFADFMAGIAEDACEVAPMVDNKQLAGDKRVEKRTKERGFVHAHDATTVPGQITKERVDIKPCRVCQSTEHKIRNCDEFKNLTQADKTALVVKWKICRICLNEHGDSRCRFKIQCNVEQCRERHHPLMHGEAATTHAAEATEVTHNAHRVDIGQMQFRLVAVTLHHGTRSVRTTAFLDEGSSMSLVERSLVDVLGVKGGELEPLRLIWTADISRTEKNSKKISVQISTAGCDQKHQLALRTVTELKLPTPSFKISSLTKQFKHLGDFEVDDNLGKPRLLLGLDNLHLFAPQESRIGQPNEPIAVKSKLGWSVYGPSSDNKCGGGVVGTHFTENISNQELHDLIKEYFAVEEAGVTAGVLESDDDRRARVILENTTVKVGGRYETGLLWRSDDYDFPNSYPMAVRRLEQLEKKLSKNPELAENVRRQITEYQLKEYAHKATPKELSDSDPRKVWYIPLSVVVNPRKSKVRLVWDAAASVNGVSLNSQLLKGPDLLVSLIEVLCRFRERPVAFGGDLQEMYHQVRIRSEDKQAQRFLFRDNPTLKPDVYVMDVATFGATSSPASAQFVKNKNAAEFAHVHPEAAAAIIQRHYVDDYFDSADTEEEAIERAQAVKHIHAQGGFHIRNWVSNSSRFLEALGEPNQKQNVQFTSDKHTNTERILGITWNPVLDVFVFSIPTNEALQPFMTGKARPTKSIVLKFLMSFFDPLGLIAHYLVHGKILMQDIWRSGCDWKATINDDCYAGCTQWIKWLPLLEQLQIPRSYFGDIRSSKIESVELHVFSDASEKAYGSGAYLRIVCDGAIRCTLALAKTKVAPLKLLSIPRLEVSGAVLGARLANTAETCHSLPISRRVFWMDSATVIAWIHSDHRKYKPFVAHRISEILSLTSVDEWHFVSTKSNVADDLTKWRKRFTMSCEDRSIRGPDFIYTDSKSWSVPATPIESVEEELRAAFLFHEIHLPEPVIDAERFSSWKTLVRSLAVIFRFRSNCQRKARGLPIEAVPATPAVTGHVKGAVSSTEVPLRQEEYVQAENCFWRLVQADMFPDEVKVLLKNRELPREEWHQVEKTSVIYQLSPFLDHAGVLRMEGRTEAAEELPFDLRFPVILPKKHPITIKLVEHYHRKLRHGNNETVVNEMRQRFFIGNLRAVVRMVANDCQLCKIRQSRPAVPRMAPLPVQRLQPYLRPFSFVGVDYCGPFTVTVGRRSEKRWIAVFTCFNTRAVHLEVAHSLNKQSCLMALRRFMCRYGVPREIFSDNGTNFHGANNEGVLIRAINNNCADVVTDARLKWNFNPPSAPHMGGVWERMVRSVKECLKVLDDGRKLTDEVLLTVLAEAAEIINSRPLTYQPQDASSPEALTPNHFLRVGPANEELVLGAANEGQALTDSYQRSQMLAQQMWKRWISEYVPSLNRRSKWHEEREPVKAGDLVFIADEEQRKTWIRGIVDEVIKAKDGRVRQAVVRAQGKLYKRPVAKLAVIEVGANGRSEPHSEKPRD